MADLSSDGRPQVVATDLAIRQLEVDKHGLEHQVLRNELEIERWKHEIAKHHESIEATRQRVEEISAEIAKLRGET